MYTVIKFENFDFEYVEDRVFDSYAEALKYVNMQNMIDAMSLYTIKENE